MMRNKWFYGAAFGGGWMIYRGYAGIGVKVLLVALLLLAIRDRWFSRIIRAAREERAEMAAEAEQTVVTVSESRWDEGAWDDDDFCDMDEDDISDAEDAIGDEEDAINAIYGNKYKALDRVNRALLTLYQRKDKLYYINNTSPEAWEKYQKTKTWRGLMWDIKNAEDTLARLEQMA